MILFYITWEKYHLACTRFWRRPIYLICWYVCKKDTVIFYTVKDFLDFVNKKIRQNTSRIVNNHIHTFGGFLCIVGLVGFWFLFLFFFPNTSLLIHSSASFMTVVWPKLLYLLSCYFCFRWSFLNYTSNVILFYLIYI